MRRMLSQGENCLRFTWSISSSSTHVTSRAAITGSVSQHRTIELQHSAPFMVDPSDWLRYIQAWAAMAVVLIMCLVQYASFSARKD